jgi:hypothetical protein
MKTKLQPAKMGLLRWLVETRKNPACVGDAEPTLTDIAELCYAFTVPFSELKAMSNDEISCAVEKFLENLEPIEFQEIQHHATAELKKFTEGATTPKKPDQSQQQNRLIHRVLSWLMSMFSRG